MEGNDPKLKNEFVIIGAHYDHIGKIAAVNGDDIANGANDNASGTTAVTEVMKYFAKNKTNKRSLIVCIFLCRRKRIIRFKTFSKKIKSSKIWICILCLIMK